MSYTHQMKGKTGQPSSPFLAGAYPPLFFFFVSEGVDLVTRCPLKVTFFSDIHLFQQEPPVILTPAEPTPSVGGPAGLSFLSAFREHRL